MPLSGNLRSRAKITLDKSKEEALKIAETALNKTKDIKTMETDNEKSMIKGKTKYSLRKNTYGTEFTLLIKKLGNQSQIDLFVNSVGTKVTTKTLIDPFYKKITEIMMARPEVELSLEKISQEDIESSANEERTENNISVEVSSLADEIAKLAKLKADGALSEEEFIKMKNELIDKM